MLTWIGPQQNEEPCMSGRLERLCSPGEAKQPTIMGETRQIVESTQVRVACWSFFHEG